MRGIRGLDGTLRLEVLTDRPAERFAVGAALQIEGSERVIHVADFQPASPGSFARFREVRSREAATSLIGSFLSVALSATPQQGDPISWDEVIGIMVRDTNGMPIGEIVDCYRAGGAEVYLVRTPDGGELDLPAVASVITTFEPRAGVIVANLDAMELEVRRARPKGPKKPQRPRRSRARRIAAPPRVAASSRPPAGATRNAKGASSDA